MRNRGRGRKSARLVVGVGSAYIPPEQRILTITDDGGGSMLVTTEAAHGIVTPAVVRITGTSLSAYNGLHTADDAPTATTFRELGGYIGDSTGGSWSYS